RIEDDIFQSIITRSLSMISNQESDPSFVFRKTILESLYNGSIRRMPISAEGIKQIDKERALAIYKERFADASDFVFTIVGSFTEAQLTPYVEYYLVALPMRDPSKQDIDFRLYESGE